MTAAVLPVGIEDVRAAAQRLHGLAVRTPVLESEALNRLAGVRLLIKAEPLQRTGSFKFRGAYNTLATLRPPAAVAFSSGNHAQGVAAAAGLLGIPATIVMPADAPRDQARQHPGAGGRGRGLRALSGGARGDRRRV